MESSTTLESLLAELDEVLHTLHEQNDDLFVDEVVDPAVLAGVAADLAALAVRVALDGRFVDGAKAKPEPEPRPPLVLVR